MYKLITSKGKIEYRDEMLLEDMQKFVGGYIETAGNFIFNEEGLLLKLPTNKVYPQFVGNIILKVKCQR